MSQDAWMAFRPDCPLAETVRPARCFNERAEGKPVDILLLHYTGMATAEEALVRLTAEDSGVSCHYFVDEDGRIVQLVPEEKRAWHAGMSSWHGETDINSRSIGIEIANPGHDGGYPAFPIRQIDAVVELCRNCVERRRISAERVLAHSDVAPQRKMDPGEKFPWRRLHESGVGHLVEPVPVRSGRFFQRGESGQPVEALQSMLCLYGYGPEINGFFDEKTEACVRAFQRHFRPGRVDGVADISTIETLHRLISTSSKYS